MIPGLIGGIVGLVGGVLNGWTEVRKHKAETERMQLSWEHDEIMFAKTSAAKSEQNADDAFRASLGSDSAAPWLPDGVSAWVATPLILVESLRRATRPVLTWLLVILAYQSPDSEGMTNMAGMAVGWWFGTRTTKFLSK